MNCPSCNKPLKPDARFCGHCGYQLAQKPRSDVKPRDLFSIDIKHKDVLKINETRNKAKKIDFLIAKPSDWVNAYGTYGDTKFPLKIRLKGLLRDHWQNDGFWSFKIKLKGDNTFLGMKRFELQHPRTRSYLNDWYFHKVSKNLGLIAPRYGFARVFLNGRRPLSGGIFFAREMIVLLKRFKIMVRFFQTLRYWQMIMLCP